MISSTRHDLMPATCMEVLWAALPYLPNLVSYQFDIWCRFCSYLISRHSEPNHMQRGDENTRLVTSWRALVHCWVITRKLSPPRDLWRSSSTLARIGREFFSKLLNFLVYSCTYSTHIYFIQPDQNATGKEFVDIEDKIVLHCFLPRITEHRWCVVLVQVFGHQGACAALNSFHSRPEASSDKLLDEVFA